MLPRPYRSAGWKGARQWSLWEGDEMAITSIFLGLGLQVAGLFVKGELLWGIKVVIQPRQNRLDSIVSYLSLEEGRKMDDALIRKKL